MRVGESIGRGDGGEGARCDKGRAAVALVGGAPLASREVSTKCVCVRAYATVCLPAGRQTGRRAGGGRYTGQGARAGERGRLHNMRAREVKNPTVRVGPITECAPKRPDLICWFIREGGGGPVSWECSWGCALSSGIGAEYASNSIGLMERGGVGLNALESLENHSGAELCC